MASIPEPTVPTRKRFDSELHDLKVKIRAMAAAAQSMFEMSVKGVIDNDPDLLLEIIGMDDRVDEYYLELEQRVHDVLVRQTPVASDLRFLTSLLHITLHLERVADIAVNIAKIGRTVSGLPRSEVVVTTLGEMGGIALRMVEACMDAFARRDLQLCLELPTMDDPVDRLNRGILKEILPMSDDRRMLEWGMQMHVVSRQIERVADHCVDIAEQSAYMITGEFREFTDASHPQ
ncbi:MAG: phosphate signaling complex protein PhoU [Actinomycetota bacterium]